MSTCVWRIGAEKSGYARAETTVTATGEPIENLEIRLQPTQGVTLRVSRALGAPPAQVMVSVLQGGTHLSTGEYTTGESGRVRLSTVPPGTWELLVRGNDTSTERVLASSPGPPVDVVLAPGFLDHVCEMSQLLHRKLAQLVARHPKIFVEVRGKGLLAGLRCQIENTKVINALFRHGLVVVGAGDNVIRLLPPLIVEEQHIDEAIEKLDTAARELVGDA